VRFVFRKIGTAERCVVQVGSFEVGYHDADIERRGLRAEGIC